MLAKLKYTAHIGINVTWPTGIAKLVSLGLMTNFFLHMSILDSKHATEEAVLMAIKKQG